MEYKSCASALILVEPLFKTKRPLLLLAAGGVLGIGLASVQLIPSLELQALTPRQAGA